MKNAGLQCREGAPEPGQFRKVRFADQYLPVPKDSQPRLKGSSQPSIAASSP